MFIPTHLVTPHTDLMLQDTRRNGRPLTRWEITQQASRHDRLVAPYLHRDERETRHDTPHHPTHNRPDAGSRRRAAGPAARLIHDVRQNGPPQHVWRAVLRPAAYPFTAADVWPWMK